MNPVVPSLGWHTSAVGSIRVMQVIARMNVGGPAIHIDNLTRGLDRAAFESTLVTGYCGHDEVDYLDTHALECSLVRLPALGRSLQYRSDVRALAGLVRTIRAERPHIVHTHTAKAGTLGRVAVRMSGVPTRVVHTFHGHLLHGYFGTSTTRVVVEMERFLAHRTDLIVAVGAQVRDDLLAAGIGRAGQYTVIHPGVAMPTLPSRSSARRALGLPDDVIIVTMMGRITHIKRPDRFADVVARVAAATPGVHFAVAGGGDQEDALRLRVQQCRLPVTMLGWRADVGEVLAASDIMLLTSDNEGTPVSLIEAGLAGLPSVATHVGSVPEVVADGVTGILVPPSVDALALAVSDLARSEACRRRMGDAARLRAQELFGVDRSVHMHEVQYDRLAHDTR